MNWNKLKTDKTFQGLVALILLIGLLAGSVCWSIMDIMEKSKTIESCEVKLADARQELAYLQKLAQNDKETKSQLERYRALLPTGINQDGVLAELQTLCNQYGVTASQISFGEKSTLFNLNTLPMNISLQGSYEKTMKLLEDFRYGQRLISINSLSAERNSSNINVQTAVTVYYR